MTPESTPAPPPAAPAPGRWERAVAWGIRIENGVAALALFLMAVLPVLEMGLRFFLKTGIPGSTLYVQNLTLWVGFLGAMVASREKRHLALATGADRLPGAWKRAAAVFAATASAAVSTGLAWAAGDFVRAEMDAPAKIADWLPIWVVESVLLVAFAAMALRFVWQAGGWLDRAVALAGLPLAWAVGFLLAPHAAKLLWPGVGLLVAAGALGAPIFVAIGGSALLFFSANEVTAAAIPVATYQLVTSPSIPAIPLFTLTGFLVAEGKASERLLRLFQALFAWMPGGLAIVATLVCAFFTTFTGASGVTILALGGLLLPMLLRSGYGERFSIGLLTAAGSIGLLFPPSLPVILYAVQAKIAIPDLFLAGALPGTLLVLSVAALGLVEARRAKVPRLPFHWREARAALWESKWEVLLPVIALWGIFGGYCTLIEAAALTAVYALFIGTVVHRELHPWKDLPGVMLKSIMLVGGVIAIMGVAMGLTNYLIFDEVPMRAAEWVKANVHSRFLFLLALNAALIVVGAMMDIFSAIMVIVPLMLPIATQAFGINPVHLGIIFLANLELGYLVPPVGENLFLSSYRFDRPILKVAAYTVPFMIAILVAVLIITYVPGLALIGVAPPKPG
jgi:tripartite ATP-independent transporter DctM subunit